MSSIASFRIRLKSRLTHKSRSPPDSAGSGTTNALESPEESEKCCTPYRLPRISPRGTPAPGEDTTTPVPPSTRPESDSDKAVWGRFGYEDNIRMPELGPSVHKAQMNPLALSVSSSTSTAGARAIARGQRHRMGTAMMVPQFRSAAITPTITPTISARVVRRSDQASAHVYQSMLDKAAHLDCPTPVNPAPTPTPTAISRSVSPAKSTQSIHWTLGSTHRHLLFDRKGQGRNQGPYSREFTVRCMAPSNWMRMKWGRQRTMVH